MSIAVADGLHHRGVGTLLVEHLASSLRVRTASPTFTADALSENYEVLRLFTDLGWRVGRRFEGPEVRCTIALDEDDTYLAAVEARGLGRRRGQPGTAAAPRRGRRGRRRTPARIGGAVLLHHLRCAGLHPTALRGEPPRLLGPRCAFHPSAQPAAQGP